VLAKSQASSWRRWNELPRVACGYGRRHPVTCNWATRAPACWSANFGLWYCPNVGDGARVVGRFFEEFWVKIAVFAKPLIKSITESGFVRGLELAALAQWLWEYWYVSLGAALLVTLIYSSATGAKKKGAGE
jgi:hypothetical protein